MNEQERFEAYLKSKFAGRYTHLESKLGIRISIGELYGVWQAATAQAVPEGHVVVPVEPTQEIFRKFYDGFNVSNGVNTAQRFKDGYKAMIKAAQEQNQ